MSTVELCIDPELDFLFCQFCHSHSRS